MSADFHVEDNGLRENFFKTEGRLNRWRYFKRRLALGVTVTLLLTLGYRIFGYEFGQASAFATIYNAVISLAFVVPTYCLNVRRLQDMNRGRRLAIIYAALTAVLAFLDFTLGYLLYVALVLATAALALSLYLFVSPGTRGANSYGPSPIPLK